MSSTESGLQAGDPAEAPTVEVDAVQEAGAVKGEGGPVAEGKLDEAVIAAAKERAAEVVLAYREVDWDQVEAGSTDAVAALLEASERDEQTRTFLDGLDGELGGKLLAGLERLYASEVGPQMRRPGVLRSLTAPAPAAAPAETESTEADGLTPRRRPAVTVGHTVRMTTGCGNLYVTINETEDGQPLELFNHMGKAGGCAASQNEAIGRLISYALRCGASMEPLIKQLKGISCHRPAWSEDGKVSSCADAIGKSLEKYYVSRASRPGVIGDDVPPTASDDGVDRVPDELEPTTNGNVDLSGRLIPEAPGDATAPARNRIVDDAPNVQGACPDCGGNLSFEEGCVKCYSCGFTQCG